MKTGLDRRIGALIGAKPTERRLLLEEAAGISRYKQRRKEAEQRLVRTQDNLERLRDVLLHALTSGRDGAALDEPSLLSVVPLDELLGYINLDLV